MKNTVSAFLVIVLFVTAVFIAVPTQTVYAGSKGQQLELKSNPSTTFTVTGNNQRGETVTKSFRTAMSGTVKTNGYWWVGPVTVTVIGLGGLYKTCYANVPLSQRSDYYTITCK